MILIGHYDSPFVRRVGIVPNQHGTMCSKLRQWELALPTRP